MVAPGPAIAKHAAGVPVSFAYADAAKDAAPSCRIPMYCSFPASTWRRIASAKPRLDDPTMPNTARTSQFSIVSTITSETVRTCGGDAGRPT